MKRWLKKMSNEQEGAKVFKVELGVGKPVRNRIRRKGRGFSRLELKEAGSTVLEARRFSIPIDTKRKSMHDFNISVLKELIEEERASSVRAELEKEVIKEEYQEFTQIRGVGLSSAEQLVEMGITSIEELAALEVEKLDTDIPIATIKRWVRNAKKHLGEDIEEEELEELEELEDEIEELEATELTDLEAELEEIGSEEEKEVEEISEDEVTVTEKEEIYKELLQVRGIGKKTAEKIVALGVTSIEELAALEVDMVPETADVSTNSLRNWVKNAQKHLKRESEEIDDKEITDEELDKIEAEIDELEDLDEEDIDALLLEDE